MNNQSQQKITNFDQYSETWCLNCDQQIYYLPSSHLYATNSHHNLIIKCPECAALTPDVLCEKCGIGGAFIENIDQKPGTWTCPNCHTNNLVDQSIYAQPIVGITKRTSPPDLRKSFYSPTQLHPILKYVFIIIFFITVMLASYALDLVLYHFGIRN